jgi:hypothetical protein
LNETPPKLVSSPVKKGVGGEHLVKIPRLSCPGYQYLARVTWSGKKGSLAEGKAAHLEEGDPNSKPRPSCLEAESLGQLLSAQKNAQMLKDLIRISQIALKIAN